MYEIEEFKPYTYNLISADKDWALKTDSGLYTARDGSEYELAPQVGKMLLPSINSEYGKDETVIFEHDVIDQKTTMFGGFHLFATNEQIIGKIFIDKEYDKVGNAKVTKEIQSNKRIVCKKIEEEKIVSQIIEVKQDKKYKEQQFEVVYSPFAQYKKGDKIIVKKDYDYPIDKLDVTFVKEEDVLYNLTTSSVMNELNMIKVEAHDKYLLSNSGIYLQSVSNKKKGVGEYVDGERKELKKRKVYFKGGFLFNIDKQPYIAVETFNIIGYEP